MTYPEKRIFIFKDHAGNIIARKTHDSSLIHSLPRVGDEIYTAWIFPDGTKGVISGLVQRAQFDYIGNNIVIFVKID